MLKFDNFVCRKFLLLVQSRYRYWGHSCLVMLKWGKKQSIRRLEQNEWDDAIWKASATCVGHSLNCHLEKYGYKEMFGT